MTYRHAVWGFANGVTVLAIAGLAWFSVALGLGLGPMAGADARPLMIGLAVLMYVGFGGILIAAFRLRRLARGFRLAEARAGEARQWDHTRRIMRGFYIVNVGQLGLILLTAVVCSYVNRQALVVPLVGLIVSAHFLPLAAIFGVTLYYWTGGLGLAVTLIALAALAGPARFALLGGGLGTVAWASAIYLVSHADEMARAWAAADGPK
jgi:hypothetical protein